MKVVKRMLVLLVVFVVGLAALTLWAAGGVQLKGRTFDAAPETVAGVETKTSTSVETLRVAVYNIAWGYGWGSEGSGGAQPPEHFATRLERMGRALADAKVDVVLLQESDFRSARSHDVDQAHTLAKAAGLPYVAKAVSWTANYLPFPYWPPKNHFGRMLSGGAILSRYPFTKNTVMLEDKPEDNGLVYNLGYLYRYLQKTEIDAAGRRIGVYNVHTDAFSPKNRIAHAGRIARTLTEDKAPLALLGGDFNTVPPEASMRGGYPDEPDTDHSDDPTIARIREIPGMKDTLTQEAYLANERAYFTFPGHAPNRKLDFLFASEAFEVTSFRVLTEAGDASDHLPILVELRLPAP